MMNDSVKNWAVSAGILPEKVEFVDEPIERYSELYSDSKGSLYSKGLCLFMRSVDYRDGGALYPMPQDLEHEIFKIDDENII